MPKKKLAELLVTMDTDHAGWGIWGAIMHTYLCYRKPGQITIWCRKFRCRASLANGSLQACLKACYAGASLRVHWWESFWWQDIFQHSMEKHLSTIWSIRYRINHAHLGKKIKYGWIYATEMYVKAPHPISLVTIPQKHMILWWSYTEFSKCHKW